MGRLNIESVVWTDGRITLLANRMGWCEDKALGVMCRIWNCSQDRETTQCTAEQLGAWLKFRGDIDIDFFIEALCESEFFDRKNAKIFSIRGNKRHIEGKKKYAEGAKKGGVNSGRKRRELKRKANEVDFEPRVEANSIQFNSKQFNSIHNSFPSDKPPGTVELLPPPDTEPKIGKPKTLGGNFVWDAYERAYEQRYNVVPIRNAKTNALCSQLAKRLGVVEAVQVVAFYVTHGNSWYVQKGHDLKYCVSDAEKLHMEWRTNTKITSVKAVSSDRDTSNADAIRSYFNKKQNIENREGK